MIGKRLEEFRKHFNLNQSQLGEIIGIKKAGVSLIENEERGIDSEQILKICKAYDVDVRFFFGQIEEIREAPKESPLEGLQRRMEELEKKVDPVSKLDPVAERVMINAELHDVVEKLMYYDAGLLREIKALITGYIAHYEAVDKKRAS